MGKVIDAKYEKFLVNSQNVDFEMYFNETECILIKYFSVLWNGMES